MAVLTFERSYFFIRSLHTFPSTHCFSVNLVRTQLTLWDATGDGISTCDCPVFHALHSIDQWTISDIVKNMTSATHTQMIPILNISQKYSEQATCFEILGKQALQCPSLHPVLKAGKPNFRLRNLHTFHIMTAHGWLPMAGCPLAFPFQLKVYLPEMFSLPTLPTLWSKGYKVSVSLYRTLISLCFKHHSHSVFACF